MALRNFLYFFGLKGCRAITHFSDNRGRRSACPLINEVSLGVQMNNKIRTEAVRHLFEAILTLEDEEECFQFFEDLCTVNELLSLSQRFEVASMLKRKDTYLKIAEKTGASTATISRVNRSLNYGNDGYDMVFARMASYQNRDAD